MALLLQQHIQKLYEEPTGKYLFEALDVVVSGTVIRACHRLPPIVTALRAL